MRQSVEYYGTIAVVVLIFMIAAGALFYKLNREPKTPPAGAISSLNTTSTIVSSTPRTLVTENAASTSPMTNAAIVAATHMYAVATSVTFQDGPTTDNLIPDTVTLSSIGVATSSSMVGGIVEDKNVILLGFNIVSGWKNLPSDTPSSTLNSIFCTEGFNQAVRWLYDEKGDTVPGDFVEPENQCVGSFVTMDNVEVGFDVPGPGAYTFLFGTSTSPPSASGSLPYINFTVILSPYGGLTFQGPATKD